MKKIKGQAEIDSTISAALHFPNSMDLVSWLWNIATDLTYKIQVNRLPVSLLVFIFCGKIWKTFPF